MNIPTPTVKRMVEYGEDAFIASGDSIVTYGVGDTPEEAIADYIEDANEFYAFLVENREKLAPGMINVLSVFESA